MRKRTHGAEPQMPPTLALKMPATPKAASPFGKRLVVLRKARGVTQTQLADAIGSTQRAISYYENEAEAPPGAVVAAMARALGTSTDELLGLKKTPRPKHPTDEPDVRRAWNKFQQLLTLPEKDQRAVIRLVNSLVAAQNNGG